MSISRVKAVPTRPEYVDTLLRKGLRRADVLEVWRIGGESPENALQTSVAGSEIGVTLLRDGEVVAVCGVCTFTKGLLSSPTGAPWLLACDEFESPDTAKSMARISRVFIDHWHKVYGRLENVADPLHGRSLRYLQWLGFTFDWDVPLYGPHGDRLVRFWR